MEVKSKKKYDNERHTLSTKRIARCGHRTEEGRYFLCERCQPTLESDDNELIYFQTETEHGENV